MGSVPHWWPQGDVYSVPLPPTQQHPSESPAGPVPGVPLARPAVRFSTHSRLRGERR